MPARRASSRASGKSVTPCSNVSRPSPETSMTERVASISLPTMDSTATESASPIPVPPNCWRGIVSTNPAKASASLSEDRVCHPVVCFEYFCWPQIRTLTAIRLCVPERMAARTAGSRKPRAIPRSCKAYSPMSMLLDASTARTSSRSTVSARTCTATKLAMIRANRKSPGMRSPPRPPSGSYRPCGWFHPPGRCPSSPAERRPPSLARLRSPRRTRACRCSARAGSGRIRRG